MADRPKSLAVRSSFGWLVPLAFLALPSCTFPAGKPNFEAGSEPLSSVIFCDIEDKSVPRHCATSEELMLGISLSQAAVALSRVQSSNIGLDYSPQAIADHGCAPGQPVAITFKGLFPDGFPVCLNCGGVIGPVYADANEACATKCADLHGFNNPPLPEVAAFCAANARTSTNAPGCFDGACTDGGGLKMDFEDPRRVPEPVAWQDFVGTDDVGPESNTLRRTAATTVPVSAFDAGAASSQVVTRGDAYVEFTAVQTDKTRALGFALGAPPDGDPTISDINFAISLSSDGHVFVVENGVPVPGPNPDLSFATYVSGDRMRVAVTDRHDGNADITYLLIPQACPTSVCTGIPLRTVGPAPYPFRVDASLRELMAELNDVRIVRIK